jgi:hypothetical protein
MLKSKKIRYLHTEKQDITSLTSFIKKQILGVTSLIICIILSIPGVPGPGFVFFILALLLLEYPGKTKLFLYLKTKRFFRISRVILWKKLHVFLVLPKE